MLQNRNRAAGICHPLNTEEEGKEKFRIPMGGGENEEREKERESRGAQETMRERKELCNCG